ncbi:pyruvate dehydrogenase phosphatase regulatory subunit, mitochondrial-like isoform X2 [Panthera pardus]|uniref:Pyruvate dehydrogenase phosphatase regulatory subunit, mitochondrial-like isoform X2 n=1 Tax=Panthera pardus TaxID=9691 RepID=A0A9W2VVP4_PANPR|nr:pyruvate dehydrogenase phosphatase regulatory subunit, mitochondrial-like isoform X2 [Panthera pardus]
MFSRLLSVARRQRTGRGWQNWSSGRSGAPAAEAHSVALPAQAQVVICGGGIMGTSVAYHLSKMGWKDIVLLEQGRLAAGSTRFCAGILSTARHLTIEQKMADYSNKLYQQLEQETGIQTDGTSQRPAPPPPQATEPGRRHTLPVSHNGQPLMLFLVLETVSIRHPK